MTRFLKTYQFLSFINFIIWKTNLTTATNFLNKDLFRELGERQRAQGLTNSITNEPRNKYIKTSQVSSESIHMNGNMFDIIPHRNMTIIGFDIEISKNTSNYVEIWTRKGAYKDFLSSSKDWSLVTNETIENDDIYQGIISVTSGIAVEVTHGIKQAFYIILEENGKMHCTDFVDIGSNEAFIISRDLDIVAGSAIQSRFNSTSSNDNFLWKGALHYSIPRTVSQNRLLTPFPNENSISAFGFAIQLKAWTDIIITSLDLRLNTYDSEFIQVFATDGSYKADTSNWKEVTKVIVKGKGFAGLTSLPSENFFPLEIRAGEVKTIIIKTSNQTLASTETNTDDITYFMNDDVTIQNSNTIVKSTNLVSGTINWNGMIRYTQPGLDECDTFDDVPVLIDVMNKTLHFGTMFYFLSAEYAQIETLQIFTNSVVNYTIWTRRGSFQALSKFNATEWSFVAKGVTSASGVTGNSPTLINPQYFSPIEVVSSIPQAIYINTEGNSRALSLSSGQAPINGPIASDGIMSVLEGREISQEGVILDSALNFTGTVYYSSITECDLNSTLSPTSLPTIITASPSSSPTLITVSPTNVTSNLLSQPTNSPSSFNTSFPTQVLANQSNTSIPTQNPLSASPTYLSRGDTPSNSPSSLQSKDDATSNSVELVKMNYTFSIEHDSVQDPPETLKNADTAIFNALTKFLSDNEFAIKGDVVLLTVASFFSRSNVPKTCFPTQFTACSVIDSTLQLRYNGLVSLGQLRYMIFTQGYDVAIKLPFSHRAYIGVNAMLSNSVIGLAGTKEMDSAATSYYEDSVKGFLNEMIGNVAVLEVTTDSSQLDIISSEEQRNRRLQETSNSDTLEVVTGVFGEYQPPPEVELDNLVKDAIETSGDVLVERLKKNPSFANLNSIAVRNDKPSSPTSAPMLLQTEKDASTENTDGAENTSLRLIIIIVCSSVIGALLVVCLVCAIKSVRSKELARLAAESTEHYLNGTGNYSARGQGSRLTMHLSHGGQGVSFYNNDNNTIISKRTYNMMHR